jgi:hypothetical protein
MATGSGKAFLGVALGALAVVALPAAIAATEMSDSYTLLQAGFAVPLALILGVAAIVLARAVRARSRATLVEGAGPRAASTGRLLGILGVCIACAGAIALGVYALLTYLE